MSRDPRFDELSGTFNQEMFDKAYSFLNDVKANEKKVRKYVPVVMPSFLLFFFFLACGIGDNRDTGIISLSV